MRYLIDTHIYLWWLKNSPDLSKEARTIITNAEEVYVSSASIWEIGIKVNLKKIKVDVFNMVEEIEANGFIELPITSKHAAAVSKLESLHRDPFDRMLIAQAITEPLRFLTADKFLKKYSDLVQVV